MDGRSYKDVSMEKSSIEHKRITKRGLDDWTRGVLLRKPKMAFADHRENTVNHKLYFDLETGRGVIANPYYDDVTIKSESESFTLRSGIIRT